MSDFTDFYEYSKCKEKIKNYLLQNVYYRYLLNADLMMFEYDDLPEDIDRKFLESYLCLTGATAIQRKGSRWFIAPYPARTGTLDQYGDGNIIEASTLNGEFLTGTAGKDIGILYNNLTRSRDLDIMTDTEMLTDIERSSHINVLFARIAPVFLADSSITGQKLDDVIKDIMSGKISNIISNNQLSTLGLSGDGPQSIDVTQPERIQYVQYLSELYDNVIRRHFGRRGLNIRTSSKHAQVSSDEVHGMDCVAWFYPLNKLQARQQGLDMVNQAFGTNIKVRFSDLWQREYDRYQVQIKADDQAEQAAQDDVQQASEGGDDSEKDAD